MLVLLSLACAPPPVIVLAVDTLRADLGGAPEFFDQRDARVYTAAYAASNATPNSVPTLLTGLLPQEHGWILPVHDITRWPTEGPEIEAPSWAEVVVSDNPWVVRAGRALPATRSVLVHGYPLLPGGRARAVAAATRREVEQGAQAIYAQPLGPHVPLARGVYVDILTSEDPEAVAAWWQAAYALAVQDTVAAWVPLLRELEDAGWLVIVTSDHGEALGEGGRWGHGRSLDDEQVRVPLVVWGPGIEGGIDDRFVPATCVGQTARAVLGEDVACDLRTGRLPPEPPVVGMMREGTWEERVIVADAMAVTP